MSEMPNASATAVMINSQTVREVIGVVGAVVAGYGAWMHYPPAGFMVAGGILVSLAIVGTLRGAV